MENEPIQRPFQIVSSENSSFTLQNLETLTHILESDDLRDHQMVVVSIAGALRQGKSFLLNFFLKYLNAQYQKHNVEDWIGRNGNNEPLIGFSWRGGKERETIGIWMWSEIFTHAFEDGEKVGIILMDTQGIFDSKSSLKECISIFAISMLLPSVLCYNVMRQIREDDLTNLHLFAEYAKFAMEDRKNEKPFQKLLFIVRDWPFSDNNDFGLSKEYVEDILTDNDEQETEMRELRCQIKNSFADIDAFLMPYPGRSVAEQKTCFFGESEKIKQTFVDCVEQLTKEIFAPSKLIRKTIGGQAIQAVDFLVYLKTFVCIFNGNKLPQPITILRATAAAHLNILCKQCLEIYFDEMQEALIDTDVYCDEDVLQQKHMRAMEKAMSRFKKRPKLGCVQLQSDFMETLGERIKKSYDTIHDTNKSEKENVETKKKRIFASITIATTVAGAIGSVVMGGPLFLGLFNRTIAEAGLQLIGGLVASGATGGSVGGASIGIGVNKLLPRKWFGSECALDKMINSLKNSQNDIIVKERKSLPKKIEFVSANIEKMPNIAAVESDSTENLAIQASSAINTASMLESNIETIGAMANDTGLHALQQSPRVFDVRGILSLALQLARYTMDRTMRRFIPRLYYNYRRL